MSLRNILISGILVIFGDQKVFFFLCAVLFQETKNYFLSCNHFFIKFIKNTPRLLHLQLRVYFLRKTYESPKKKSKNAQQKILPQIRMLFKMILNLV